MLSELRIENFAIIQTLEVNFSSGLVTLTGETGAGKSIILDAIQTVIGGRADPTMIRAGASRALVEATFRLGSPPPIALMDLLKNEDLLDDPDTLILGRELRREGRSSARINGRSASLNLLREVGSYLVDIHGQSEHLSLLNIHSHLDLLDRFARVDAPLSAYRKCYDQFSALRRELAALRQAEADAERRTDLLSYQLREIESAHLKPGEEISLRQERDRLANAENLSSLAQQALVILDDGSPEAPALTDQIGLVEQALASLARIDSSQENLSEQAQAVSELLSDLGRSLRDYLENIEFNPRRLEQLEDRLDLLHKLQRKYGGNVDAVLAFAENARRELETIAHASERIAELETRETSLLSELAMLAKVLSEKRHSAAQLLEKAVEKELADLSMNGARFGVDFRTQPAPDGLPIESGVSVAYDSTGCDRVEFLIAPNPGEGLKPLVKIASGGETSRLMLALKNVLAQADAVPTLIFDEIDQGIGGRVGMMVGEKLWQLGRRHQVLCVTHLPQLAVFGDQHYAVRKLVESGRTQTRLELLTGESRLDELALMLGQVNEVNRRTAQETLITARNRTAQLKV
ncbi:MAG TPA: DNA repair protein RecN [Anaerolineaceae bacterium]